jgi:hypothetical protein
LHLKLLFYKKNGGLGITLNNQFIFLKHLENVDAVGNIKLKFELGFDLHQRHILNSNLC